MTKRMGAITDCIEAHRGLVSLTYQVSQGILLLLCHFSDHDYLIKSAAQIESSMLSSPNRRFLVQSQQ